MLFSDQVAIERTGLADRCAMCTLHMHQIPTCLFADSTHELFLQYLLHLLTIMACILSLFGMTIEILPMLSCWRVTQDDFWSLFWQPGILKDAQRKNGESDLELEF